jgi:hypothetical protein
VSEEATYAIELLGKHHDRAAFYRWLLARPGGSLGF